MNKPSETQILNWLKSDLSSFATYLVSGTVHGKPGLPVAELERLHKIISKNFSEKDRFALGKKLATLNEYAARSLSCGLLSSGWPGEKEITITKMLKLANDENWIVRESAAGLFAALLKKDFKHFSNLYAKWIATESTNVKRAIALAVKYDSKRKEPSTIKTYLALIEPLLSEPDEYIRKNLGPFAIGDGLLPRFPQETLKAITKWSRSTDENVRWNIAMIFTAAQARAYVADAIPVLEKLASDDRRFVWRPVCSALRNLAKENDKLVKQTLADWRKNTRLENVTKTVSPI